MRALILVHRWLGVGCCLFFAMWFATGIVMHFVSFPALTEAERIAGMAPVDPAGARAGVGDAVTASGIADAARVRLLARPDGLVYVVRGKSGLRALHAADLSPADALSERLALAIAVDHARRRELEADAATVIERASHDQWTVSNNLDIHRPLYRIALNDAGGTELYVSSTTGEVVRDTTRRERLWNYAGSVAHWIYPTVLRRHRDAWANSVWALSLVALIAACSGAVIGMLRIRLARRRLLSPYEGWQAWHHWLGLSCMAFLLTWIFSGWLSLDDGRLFSNGKPAAAESLAFASPDAWQKVPARGINSLARPVREIEWFGFDGRIYTRVRFEEAAQQLSAPGDSAARHYLLPEEVTAAARRLAPGCRPAAAVPPADDYPYSSVIPGAPVYRSICGEAWFHVDAATGAMLEKLDPSRRAYRWLYGALHNLDFPALAARPLLRTGLVVTLCAAGLAFSFTGVVIGWRRLRRRPD
jgi:uncharacterized iron-regulated membrane protein